MFEIRLAQTQQELDDLYRFRYRIYVEEMGRVQLDADHERKTIQDALDEHGHNLLAFRYGKLVGAARINFNELCTPFYYELYQMNNQSVVTNKNASIVTRLMIDETYRKSTLAVRIFIACYEFGLWRGIRCNFVDCNDHLIDFFKSFGYQHYIGKATHKEYGEVNPLKLDLHDEALFRQINSPFLKPYLAWKHQQDY